MELKNGFLKYFIIPAIAIAIAVAVFLYFSRNAAPKTENSSTQRQLYSNPYFRISLEYPAGWLPDVAGQAYKKIPLRFKGLNGYFGIDAIGAGKTVSIDDAVKTLAIDNPRKPYGQKPDIKNIFVDGNEARIIMPSADQAIEANREAVIIVKYPKAVEIGSDQFYFFMLYADSDHIFSLGDTLKFSVF